MKLRVGDVIEDRRYPSSRYIGVVTEVCGDHFAKVAHMRYDIRANVVRGLELDSSIDPAEDGIVLLTPNSRLELVSAGPMASTVDKCSPRCEYQYGESSVGACDGLPCGLPATKQVGEFSACAKHERQMEEV